MLASQPASSHPHATRVVVTGATTSAVVSQNFLRASARSKTSLTQIDSLRASYPLKLLSPSSANTYTTRVPVDQVGVRPQDIKTTTLSFKNNNDNNRYLLPPPPRIVYIITYGGGLLADDHPDLKIVLTRHAKLLVLGQGNTKIYKSPSVDHPPASQTLHSTVAPGGVLLFLGPAVVACEDSSVFLRHEILLQAQRRPLPGINDNGDVDAKDELPNCVVLDWITGGRGGDETWLGRRSEWRLIVRWSELDSISTAADTPSNSSGFASSSTSSPRQDTSFDQLRKPHFESTESKMVEVETKGMEEEEEEEEEFEEEEDPRDVDDREAGGPVIFRDGFLLEHNPPISRKKKKSTTSSSPQPKMTSYAPSLYPHSTIGSLFIMGPKTERLQRSIQRRFEKMTIYPGQKPEQRADFPILWSATVVQVPRPAVPYTASATEAAKTPRRRKAMMKAMVVKMASQGTEQMREFLKSLFEESDQSQADNLMDDDDDDDDNNRDGDDARTKKRDEGAHKEEGLSVIDELFGGRPVWERAFR
ncbi:hypothetical protein BG004_005230 [Podila humilis]|nr:hypothetical protein BG004_005230 [Podila humilis]